jgi:hypothetical protein
MSDPGQFNDFERETDDGDPEAYVAELQAAVEAFGITPVNPVESEAPDGA